MKNWLFSSLVIYIFAIMVYSVWSYLAFVDVEKIEWVGSLVFLPLGTEATLKPWRYHFLSHFLCVIAPGPVCFSVLNASESKPI